MDLHVFLSNGTTGHVTCRLAVLQGHTMPQFVLMNKIPLQYTGRREHHLVSDIFCVTLESGS